MFTHGDDFPRLDLADFEVIANILGSHPAKPSLQEKRQILRCVHSGVNITGNPEKNHQLFLYAQKCIAILPPK